MSYKYNSLEKLESLIDLIASLRDPENGCPWDLKQTHSSLVKYVLEEANKAVDC